MYFIQQNISSVLIKLRSKPIITTSRKRRNHTTLPLIRVPLQRLLWTSQYWWRWTVHSYPGQVRKGRRFSHDVATNQMPCGSFGVNRSPMRDIPSMMVLRSATVLIRSLVHRRLNGLATILVHFAVRQGHCHRIHVVVAFIWKLHESKRRSVGGIEIDQQ